MFCFWKKLVDILKTKGKPKEINQKDILVILQAKIDLLKFREQILAKIIEKHLQEEISEKELKPHIQRYLLHANMLSDEIEETLGNEYTKIFREYIEENCF